MQMEEIVSTAGIHSGGTASRGIKIRPSENALSGTKNHDRIRQDEAQISDTGKNMSELEKTLESLRQYTGWGNFNIDFAKDDLTGSMVIKVIDRETGETLRQIPPEEMLKLRSHMQEILGKAFDHLA